MKENLYDIKIIRSGRKTLSIEITRCGDVIVRAPYGIAEEKIYSFAEKNISWISSHAEKRREKAARETEFDKHREEAFLLAKKIIPERVEYYARIMNVIPTGIKITGAKTRFGSCSSKNSLCFSYRLMMYPPNAVDYVVVHELSHILYHNHGKNFWKTVEKYMPDYKAAAECLKE